MDHIARIKLGMEGYRDLRTIANGDYVAVNLREDLNTLANLLNVGSADERHGYLALLEQVCPSVEATQLAPVGISPHSYG